MLNEFVAPWWWADGSARVRIPISWISTSLMEKQQSITKQQNDPKTVWFWYGLTPPAGNNGITFVLEVSSWNLWRCPTQLPWEAWHHQPFAITRCQKRTSHRSSMRGQNCGTSLSALWQKGPPISIFGVLRPFYLQLSTLTIYYIISLFCPTLHCLLQHWIIYHCMSL